MCGVQVVLFEGWCLGFSPLPTDALNDSRLVPINERLAADYLELHQVFISVKLIVKEMHLLVVSFLLDS